MNDQIRKAVDGYRQWVLKEHLEKEDRRREEKIRMNHRRSARKTKQQVRTECLRSE